MKTISGSTYLLGYNTEPFTHFARGIPGRAFVDGKEIHHVISLCFAHGAACDVGRNAEGELMWISEATDRNIEAGPAQQPLETQSFSFETLFDPPGFTTTPQTALEPAERVDTAPVNQTRWQTIRSSVADRKVVFAVAGAGFVVALAAFVLVPRPVASNTVQLPVPLSSISAEQQPADPAQAAIDFIVSGKVDGYLLPEGSSAEDLHAEVISTSGEVVLVEVSQAQEGQLTTFATLLLQKTGSTWRIREVYDPQSY